MKIRAVIFDVYKTLLRVGPPPADAAERWEALVRATTGAAARLKLADFARTADAAINEELAAARGAGIAYPEVYWPAIAVKVMPELARLSEMERDGFLYQHAQLQRTTSLAVHAAPVLKAVVSGGAKAGIASNAQPYTLHEMDAALASAQLSRALFDPRLVFFSFDAGFSKPSPQVFRWLGARLRAYGIEPGETLMVGDREDNDIIPAQAQGWQTALVSAESGEEWGRICELVR